MFRASIAREQHERLDDDDGTNFTRESERLFCVKVSREFTEERTKSTESIVYPFLGRRVATTTTLLCEILAHRFLQFRQSSSLLRMLLLFFLCMCFLLSSFLFRCVPFLFSNNNITFLLVLLFAQ